MTMAYLGCLTIDDPLYTVHRVSAQIQDWPTSTLRATNIIQYIHKYNSHDRNRNKSSTV